MCDVGMIVCADPAEVNCIWNLTRRLPDVVLPNTDGGVLAAGAARDIELVPTEPVICRATDAVGSQRRTGCAGGIRHIRCALGRDLDVTVNTAATDRRIKQRNARAK